MGIECITLGEIWDAAMRASCNGADKPRFRSIMDQLAQSPENCERLAFDAIQETRNCLKRKMEPWTLVGWVFRWSGAVSSTKIPELLSAVEEVTFDYFKAVPDLQYRMPDVTLPRLFHTVWQRADRQRLEALLERLEKQCELTKTPDMRLKIINDFRRQFLK